MSGISRRSFLASAAAASGVAAVPAAPAPKAPSGKPDAVFGILSDIHIGDHNIPHLTHAFEYFRDHGADGVIISGDMADSGRTSQLDQIGAAWFKVFPDNKAPDGRTVEKLFVYGNHDYYAPGNDEQIKAKHPGKDVEEIKSGFIAYNPGERWRRAFKEEWSGIYAKTVKGYTFVGAHWSHEKKLEQFLKDNEEKFRFKSSGRAFFYAQHQHPGNTCYGPWAWGHDWERSTAVLKNYPTAVVFSGHSHYSLTDERSVWQGEFTSIGASSLSYIFATYWRENGDSDRKEPVKQMPCLPQHKGKQGMLMKCYGNTLVIERLDFINDVKLGDDWIVPIDGSRAFDFEKRRAPVVAPEFASDKIPVEIKCVKGKDRKNVPTDQVVVKFPAANPSCNARVYDYEVQAVAYHEDVDYPVASKRVLSESFFLAPGMEAKTGSCVFALSEIPERTPVRFKITPTEYFGKRGRPVYSPLWTRP